jgi:hypothetical protein
MADQNSDEEGSSFFHISEDLVRHPTIRKLIVTETDFDGLLSSPLRLTEDLANGCGGQMWPAGMILAKYMLLRHQESVREKSMSDTHG